MEKPLKKRKDRGRKSGWKEDQIPIPGMIVAGANQPVNNDILELQAHFFFGVQMHDSERAMEVLRSPNMTSLCRNSGETSAIALSELFMVILTLNSHTLSQAILALAHALKPAILPRIATFHLETSHNKELHILLNITNSIALRPNPNLESKTILCRTFAALLASINGSWPKWRLVFTSHGFALSIAASLGFANDNNKQVLLNEPDSHTCGLSDSSSLVKQWSFMVKVDHLLRSICQVVPTSSEFDRQLSRNLSPGEYIARLLHASFGELKPMIATQQALRDTCCIMEQKLGKLSYEESVFGTFDSGSEILISGSRNDITTKFRSSRSSTDDGDMVLCDICEPWQHTRSTLIEDTEAQSLLFSCVQDVPDGN